MKRTTALLEISFYIIGVALIWSATDWKIGLGVALVSWATKPFPKPYFYIK